MRISPVILFSLFFLGSLLLCRVFVSGLQHSVLDAFRKVLASSPSSLEIFREEAVWDLIFSENFFYFGSASEEISGEHFTSYAGFTEKMETTFFSTANDSQSKPSGIEILQMEIISFVEFAATCNGSVHNLVGGSLFLMIFLQTFFFLKNF